MYNRYIPQSDGSYRRSSVPDSRPQPPRPEPPPPPCPPSAPPCPKQESREPCSKQQNQRRRPPPKQPPRRDPPRQESSISGFLRQLLPRDFDTNDLLVVILLLLMSGDCAEDQNTALLTLALYLFL